MNLTALLEEKRSIILEKWFDGILGTYPTDTSGFMKKQKDRFANPVGHSISQGIQGIFGALLGEKDFAEGLPFLEDIIKVRAIQDFTSAQAMGFIFLLKRTVRETLIEEIRQNQIYDELLDFESKVDELALFAFNIYVKCREQLYELKSEELKRMTHTLLKKANLAYEIPFDELNTVTKNNE
ncbi:hypothetical protein E4K68_08320 [Desulfosporosinus sp. Sb-LF]|nr:RsbRD N-terminal domain-containing protein [Desulfosporosinus sp. Sb-LF]TGE33135.1 hypothetical protein E4K68_08320 [Desulfosporosinus sp. Sb-LF]